jgi:hypothetical protein
LTKSYTKQSTSHDGGTVRRCRCPAGPEASSGNWRSGARPGAAAR